MVRVIEYIMLGTLVLGLLTFVITYAIGSNWRENVVGRYLMYFIITITGAFAYILIGPIIRSVPGRIYADLVILILLNFGAWKLTWLLRKIQKEKYKDGMDQENIR